MSGGGGDSSNSTPVDTGKSTTAVLTPINVEASSMRTPSSETARLATSRTANGYYVPPSVIYSNMFGPASGYYLSDKARTNYDPNKALAMAEQSRAYQNKTAADLATGYNATINAMAAQRQAIIDKQKAEAAAAAEAQRQAELNKQSNFFMQLLGASDSSSAAHGGLASLQGFKR